MAAGNSQDIWSGARILDDQLAQHHVRWGNERSSSTVKDDEALDVFLSLIHISEPTRRS